MQIVEKKGHGCQQRFTCRRVRWLLPGGVSVVFAPLPWTLQFATKDQYLKIEIQTCDPGHLFGRPGFWTSADQ